MTEANSTADIIVECEDSVAIVTINRAHRLNALTPAAAQLLDESLRELEADSAVRAMVLTGAGRGFCAGADISGEVGNARRVLLDFWNPLVQTMTGLDLPIIAAVNGIAAGAGVALALACDLRVAEKSARMQLSFTKIGLIPDAGSTWLLPRVVGLGRANELAMLGRPIGAEEALRWGLVNQVCDDGTVRNCAVALAREAAGLAGSIVAVKHAHHRGFESGFDDQIAYEAETQGKLQLHPDFAEAAAAFKEKRTPRRAPRVVRQIARSGPE